MECMYAKGTGVVSTLDIERELFRIVELGEA
jgi:hypothetical protein